MDSSSEDAIALKVVMDKNTKRVIFAEASSDFVDVLFSFLTLPMGTIVRLLDQHSDQTRSHANIRSFNKLYTSMSNLDAKYFRNQECKNMLINTRNSADVECRKLYINVDDTKPIQYFICENLNCTKNYRSPSLSTYSSANCTRCGKFLNRPINFSTAGPSIEDKGAFVTKISTFVITEGLYVFPNVLGSTLGLIESYGIRDFGELEEKTIQFGRNEVLCLLEYSIISKTPLADIVLGREDINLNIAVPTLQSHISSQGNNNDKKMTMKVFFQRSNNRILLGQTSADFIDFLFSFLTIPLGRVNSLIRDNYTPTPSVENIHKSVSDVNVDGYLKAQQMKEMLLSPRLAKGYLLSNHIVPLEEETTPALYFAGVYSENHYYLSFSDPWKNMCLNNKFMLANPMDGGGFVRRQTMFLVTDDLVVTPLSSMSCITYLHSLQVPPSDIEEKEVVIGVEEALNMLRASLSSTSVLTNALQRLMLEKPKEVPKENAPMINHPKHLVRKKKVRGRLLRNIKEDAK